MELPNNGQSSPRNFIDSVNFYSELRFLMYEEMRSRYEKFAFSHISFNDALLANKWDALDPDKSRDEINWVLAHQHYTAKSRFKRFDISIKSGSNLLGLAYGMPSKAKTKLKIDIVEATPFDAHRNSFKAIEVISVAAQIYGAFLGADEIRVMRPVNDKVAKYYCSYGYELYQPESKNLPVYCSMKLED